jgi:hypothetical protein
MVGIVIDEAFLRALSPETRDEVLALVEEQISTLRTPSVQTEWRADLEESYPLSVEEARKLIQAQPKPMRDALRVFCSNYDGQFGRATLQELMSAAGFSDSSDLSKGTTALTQSLRHITGNHDAWLLNWHPEDWKWSEKKQRYTKGEYFISAKGVEPLKRAYGDL